MEALTIRTYPLLNSTALDMQLTSLRPYDPLLMI